MIKDYQKVWGITEFVPTLGPTPIESKLNNELIAELKDENSFESQEDTQVSIDTLKLL